MFSLNANCFFSVSSNLNYAFMVPLVSVTKSNNERTVSSNRPEKANTNFTENCYFDTGTMILSYLALVVESLTL